MGSTLLVIELNLMVCCIKQDENYGNKLEIALCKLSNCWFISDEA